MKNKILMSTMLTILILFFVTVISAQNTDVDTGLWLEPVFTKSINKKVDLNFGGRFETKSNNSEVQEVRGYVGITVKQKNWSITTQYAYIRWQNRAGRYVNEHRPMVIISRRFNTNKNIWSFIPGLRSEFRVRPGKNDFRFVPTFAIEKKVTPKLKIFSRNELWFDTRKRDPSQYRFRTFVGFNYSLLKNLGIEPFLMYQRDVKFDPKNVLKLGVYLRIKL